MGRILVLTLFTDDSGVVRRVVDNCDGDEIAFVFATRGFPFVSDLVFVRLAIGNEIPT